MGSSSMLLLAVITAVSVTSATAQRTVIISLLKQVGDNIVKNNNWPMETILEQVGQTLSDFLGQFGQDYPHANFPVLLEELCRHIFYKEQGHPVFTGCVAVLDYATYNVIWQDVLKKLASDYLHAIGSDIFLHDRELPTGRTFIESAQGKQLRDNMSEQEMLRLCYQRMAALEPKRELGTLTLDEHFFYYASRFICTVKGQHGSSSSASTGLPWP